jgi:hypothetical protein
MAGRTEGGVPALSPPNSTPQRLELPPGRMDGMGMELEPPEPPRARAAVMALWPSVKG